MRKKIAMNDTIQAVTATSSLLVVKDNENVIERKGWFTVFGGFCIHLVLGTLYIWGNITNAVTSYLRAHDNSKITYSNTLTCYATALFFQGLTMYLGGILERQIGCKKTVLIGGIVLLLGVLLVSYYLTLEFLIVFYGAMFGIGLGICYTAPIAAAVKWMPRHKGLITGIIVAGFGLGSFVFGFAATRIDNPLQIDINDAGEGDGKYYYSDSEVVRNVPKMFRSLALCYFILVIIGAYMITDPPIGDIESYVHGHISDSSNVSNSIDSSGKSRIRTVKNKLMYQKVINDVDNNSSSSSNDDIEMITTDEVGQSVKINSGNDTNYDYDHNDAVVDNSGDSTDSSSNRNDIYLVKHELSPSEMIKVPLAWHIASCLVTTTVGGMYLAGTYKVYGQQSFKSEVYLSSVGSISSIFNAVGRIFWGAVSDRIGAVETLQISSFLFAIVILTYSYSVTFGEAGFALWTFSIFFFEGANFALYLPLVVRCFGHRYAASNYGAIFTIYSLCVVLNITVLANYNVSFFFSSIFLGIFTFIGFINLVLLSRHINHVVRI